MVFGPILDQETVDRIYNNAMAQKSNFYPYDVEAEFNPETKKPVKYYVKVALAGIPKDDISVDINDEGLLEIAVAPLIKEQPNVKILRKAISYAKKSITFDLPKEINIKEITSKYVDGLLTIELPMVVEKSKKRPIKIG